MEREKLQSLRGAGALLAASALLAVVLMHNHPHGGHNMELNRIVHGGLLMLIVVQPAVLGLLAKALDWSLAAVLGLSFFAFGSVGGCMAATINGFVVPAIKAYPQGQIGPDIGMLAWEMNQHFARGGAVAAGIGISLFGAALWRAGWRVVGGLGMLAGTVPAAMLVAGVIDMRFYGAMFTYITQLAWLATLGVALYRAAGPVSPPSTP